MSLQKASCAYPTETPAPEAGEPLGESERGPRSGFARARPVELGEGNLRCADRRRDVMIGAMTEERKTDDVEKLLSEEKTLDDRKQALIDGLLKERAAALAAFDEKLAKLGYHANAGRSKRSHHTKKAAPPAPAAKSPAEKPKD